MKAKDFYGVDYINTDGNYIHKTAIIGSNVKIGKGNIIMPYTVVGETGFIRYSEERGGLITIGDNNKIGCHVCIMSGKNGVTIIGNDNLIMNYVNVGHDVFVGNNCEIGPKTVLGGHSFISDKVIIKIACLIRNRVNIGKKAFIGMGSNVVKDVKPNTKVCGNPIREIK